MSTFHERRQTGRVFDASFRWFTDFLNGVLELSNQRIVSTHKRAPVNDILCRFEWGETCRVEKKGSKKRWKKPQEEPQRRDLSLSQDRQMCSRCRIYRTEQQNHSLQVAHFFISLSENSKTPNLETCGFSLESNVMLDILILRTECWNFNINFQSFIFCLCPPESVQSVWLFL